MRGLQYFFREAAASLWRGRGAAAVSIATIAAGLFVLGFFLLVNANLQRVIASWTDSAELSVYLRDEATSAQVAAVREAITKSGAATGIHYVSKDDARQAFAREFPDLAGDARALDRNPFPASFDVSLAGGARGAPDVADRLTTTLGELPGVADVRYDRRWLSRLNSTIRIVRGIGLAIVVMLAIACALTVANVVRLSAAARQGEIAIMQLVGAPVPYIQGPFVVEGLLQGGLGAAVAIMALAAAFGVLRGRVGALLAQQGAAASVGFVPAGFVLLLLGGGMVLGSLGGYLVARRVH